jgi:hypothetical protein
MLHYCRLFQQPKQQGHGYQQTSAGGSLSRATSATDDLQLLNALRDQQQQQYQQQLAAQASSASVLSMAASLATGGAQQRPATLARAIAGVQSNPKDWKDRVEKIDALAEVLNRQVRQQQQQSCLFCCDTKSWHANRTGFLQEYAMVRVGHRCMHSTVRLRFKSGTVDALMSPALPHPKALSCFAAVPAADH